VQAKINCYRELEHSLDLIEYFQEARNVVTLEPGHVLFSEGEPGANMYVLMSGSASVSLGNDVLEIANPGTLLGEMALVDSSARSATVIAGSNCRVISIDRPQFNVLVRESPEFAVHVMTVMANRLRHMNERLKEALRELSVRGRRPA
jgi:CRP/FNR family cyclic AMP-dependent transcriptional regulator